MNDLQDTESPIECASDRELLGAYFYELKEHFKLAERASRGFRDRINRGKYEGCDIDVRKAILDGDEQPRWCGIDWHKDPDFLPELGPLPFVFYVHEEKTCLDVNCGWVGCTQGDKCRKCKGALSAGVYAELDDRFIVNIFEDFERPYENPLGVLKRARAAKKARKAQLAAQRKERRQEAKERIIHDLGNHGGADFGRLRKPMISVPGGADAPRIIIPGR